MFCVKDLVALSSFEGAAFVAGREGLGKPILDIAVMEVPEIAHYVKAGDFLLSTLYPIYNNEQQLRSLVPTLSKIGLTGIAIKLNRYIHEIPEQMLEQANRLHFPIVILPANSNFSEQINEFLKDKINRKNGELEYRNDLHNKLMEMMLLGGEYPGLSKSLSAILQKNVALFTADGEKLAEHLVDTKVSFGAGLPANVSQAGPGELFRGCALPETHGGWFILYSVNFFSETMGYIVVGHREEFAFSSLERIAVEQFAIVYNIINQKKRAISQMETKYFDEFACDLLFNKVESNRVAVERAKSLGWRISFPIAILLLDIQQHPPQSPDRNVIINRLKKKYQQEFAGKLYEHGCCFANTGKYIAAFLNTQAFLNYEKLGGLIEAVLREREIDHYYIGISRLQARIENLEKSYYEAEKTLEIARMIGDKKLLHFKDIGIYRIIQAANNKEDLKEFCWDTIGVLIEYDKKHNASLVKTIDTIIQNGGNLKLSAAKLFVHYNTIRYRYTLIQQLLEKKFENAACMQDIYLAIKIYDTCCETA